MDRIGSSSEHELELLPYRVLQHVAKSMSMPSNVKKTYLVEMIYTKMHKTEKELQTVVQRVRNERKLLRQTTQAMKGKNNMKVQATEVSSTNTCKSPSIHMTPKRSVSPEMPALSSVVKYVPRNLSPKNTSDRVLRSYNLKAYKRPNYSHMNNALVELVREREKPPSPKNKATQISIISKEGRLPRLNVTARCVVRKLNPYPYNPRSYLRQEHQLATISTQTQNSSAVVPVKRMRPLSSVYPTSIPDSLKTPHNIIKSIGFRGSDGKISKINAVVQNHSTKIYDFDCKDKGNVKKPNVEVTIQDIINSNIYSNTKTSSAIVGERANRSAMALSDVIPDRMIQGSTKVNTCSVYYHKKIRAEQINTKRVVPSLLPVRIARNKQTLPNINKTFRRFNPTPYRQIEYGRVNSTDVPVSVPCKTASDQRHSATIIDVRSSRHRPRDVTRPLYVQVEEQEASVPQWSLETFYNLKNATSKPPSSIPTDTYSVYTAASLIATAQQTSTEPPKVTLEPVNQYATYSGTSDEVSRLCDTAYSEQDMTLRRYHEAHSAQSSPVDSQVAIEDAMELISQDGDYQERIDKDLIMQTTYSYPRCILCSWAGTETTLENHIMQEHQNDITLQDKPEWNVTFKLGSLVNQPLWLSHVTKLNNPLYILSVKYEDPDCLMVSLTTLCITDLEPKYGTITLYNKITGEPHSWYGQIPQLPSNMPHGNDSNYLRIQLSKLELLPNSANLKLINRELVLNSPSKVVVGHPELNDIHIIIFVKICDF